MTSHTRAVLRHYFACDNAKETGRRFGITERQVRRLRDEAMRRTGCRTRFELARFVMRKEPRMETMPEMLPW